MLLLLLLCVVIVVGIGGGLVVIVQVGAFGFSIDYAVIFICCSRSAILVFFITGAEEAHGLATMKNQRWRLMISIPSHSNTTYYHRLVIMALQLV